MKHLYEFMKRHFIKFLVGFLVIVLIVLFYSTYRLFTSFYDVNFWQNAVSNFIATLLGLFFGVPIALWINDIQQKAIKRDEYEKEEKEAKRRKQKILNLLKRELSDNYDLFSAFEPEIGYTEQSFNALFHIAHAAKDEVWIALSDGGEIQWIDDVDLLSTLAWTYFSIKKVRTSGKSLLQFTFFDMPQSGKVISEFLQKQFETDIRHANINLQVALEVIEKQVG
jgi:hypothetical protein